MKKTLKEQQERIKEIMIPGHSLDKIDVTKGGLWYRYELNGEEFIIIFKDENINSMMVLQPAKLHSEDMIGMKKDMQIFLKSLESKDLPVKQETDEYLNQYNKNMSQGFK